LGILQKYQLLCEEPTKIVGVLLAEIRTFVDQPVGAGNQKDAAIALLPLLGDSSAEADVPFVERQNFQTLEAGLVL
jgi:hypothetical protein